MNKCILMLVVLLGAVQVQHGARGFSISESYASTGSAPEPVDSEQENPSNSDKDFNSDKEEFNPDESEPYEGDVDYGEEDMEQAPEIMSTSKPTTTSTTTTTTTAKPASSNKSKWNKRPPKPKKPSPSSTNSGKSGQSKPRKPVQTTAPFTKSRQPSDLDDAISVSRTGSQTHKTSLSSEIKSHLESVIKEDASEAPKLSKIEEGSDLGIPQTENSGSRLDLQNKLPTPDEKPESYSIIKRMGDAAFDSPPPQRHNPSGLSHQLPWGIANFKFSQSNDDNQFSESNEFSQVAGKQQDTQSYFNFPTGIKKSPFFVGKRKKTEPEYKNKYSGDNNYNRVHTPDPYKAYDEPVRDAGFHPYMMAMMKAYPDVFKSSLNNGNYKSGGDGYSRSSFPHGGGSNKKSQMGFRNSGMSNGYSSPFGGKSPTPWEAYVRANLNLRGGYPTSSSGTNKYPQWDEVNGQFLDEDGYQFGQQDDFTESPSDYAWGDGVAFGGYPTPSLNYPSRNYKNSYQYPKESRQNPYAMYGATLTLPYEGGDVGRSSYWNYDQASYPTYTGNVNSGSSWYGGGESSFDGINDGDADSTVGASSIRTTSANNPSYSDILQNWYGGGEGHGMGQRGYPSQFGSGSNPSNAWAGGNSMYGVHPYFRQFIRNNGGNNVPTNNNKHSDYLDYLRYMKAVSNMAHWRAGLINGKNKQQPRFRKKKATSRTLGLNVTGVRSYSSLQKPKKQAKSLPEKTM